MDENKVGSVLDGTLNGLKKLVDVDTIIGKPIAVNESVTLIPISRITCGFVSGGSGFGAQNTKEHFGGGAGGGIKVIPLCFLVVRGESVRMLPITESENAVDKITEAIPDVLNKISDFIQSRKDKKEMDE